MLLLAGKNPLGNVLHLMVGPETDLFVDVHGAKIVELTTILEAMDHDRPVYMSLTRIRSEHQTEGALQAAGTPYLSSFAGRHIGETVSETCDSYGAHGDCKVKEPLTKSRPVPPISSAPPPVRRPMRRCQYCGQKKILLAIPQFRICTPCAQIELGVKRNKEEATTGVTSESVVETGEHDGESKQ